MMLEKLEKLQTKGSIVKSNPIEEDRLKINKKKKKYKNADAGFVSDDSGDED